ncbi:NAD-P-binding protein [Auriscalpium vulgare]|uniref:NAD-P-binding protein n=1 Tax=Auriscalpium vulgare TaxID=40419 RepID=A0ACB8S512_9AGAM|nr:NAD-P-binding protein [Auriscalpium vulgare]
MSGSIVWFITGCSSGIGRALAIEALDRGDKVIASSRSQSMSKMDVLKQRGAHILELDVASPETLLSDAAKNAWGIHGHIDVVVNNAGYALTGTLEESSSEEALAQFNTNVFGGLNVTRAMLPYLRARKSGTVVWIGSLGAYVPAINAGLYVASKAAIHSLGTTLHEEISPLGLRSIVIEPGYIRTSLLSKGHTISSVACIDDYVPIARPMKEVLKAVDGEQPGDPAKVARIIVDAVKGEGWAKGTDVPTVLQLGRDSVETVRKISRDTLQRLDQWEDVFSSTNFLA